MTFTPQRPCKSPGCGALVPMNEPPYCSAHRRLTAQTVAAADRWRGSAAERGYGWQWQQARLGFLEKWPVCPGMLTPTACWSRDQAMVFHDLRERQQAQGLVVRYHPTLLEWLAKNPIYDLMRVATCAATVVDHIVPHKGDPDLFWGEWNWQPLSKTYHDRKTGAEERMAGAIRE